MPQTERLHSTHHLLGSSLIDGLQHKGAPQNLFLRKSQRYIGRMPIMWTYDICAFDTGTYYGCAYVSYVYLITRVYY